MSVAATHCQGCGGELPPPKKFGKRRKWCSEACRKAQYAGVCEVCGGPTDGTTPSRGVARVCRSCHEWPEEAIIDAIRRWYEERGLQPTCADWRAASAEHPSATCVRKRIGWNEALLRAGLVLQRDRRPETQEWIEEQLRAGVPTREIADTLGTTPQNIHERMRYRGTTVKAVRNGVAA